MKAQLHLDNGSVAIFCTCDNDTEFDALVKALSGPVQMTMQMQKTKSTEGAYPPLTLILATPQETPRIQVLPPGAKINGTR